MPLRASMYFDHWVFQLIEAKGDLTKKAIKKPIIKKIIKINNVSTQPLFLMNSCVYMVI